jgi:hypothetical protein
MGTVLKICKVMVMLLFSMIFELLIYNRLNQHFQIDNDDVTEQYGFRRGLSAINTTQKLLKLFEMLGTTVDTLQVFFCDLT